MTHVVAFFVVFLAIAAMVGFFAFVRKRKYLIFYLNTLHEVSIIC